MGHLIYGASTEFEIEDRALAHLRVVILTKLRVQESFLVNWSMSREEGSGRNSIWISPGIPIQFRFASSLTPELNHNWLRALLDSANLNTGLMLMSESEAESVLQPVPSRQPERLVGAATRARGTTVGQRFAGSPADPVMGG